MSKQHRSLRERWNSITRENQSVGEADHFHLPQGASATSRCLPGRRWFAGRGRVLGERGNRGLRFNSPEARHARPRLVAAAASQLFASPRFLSVLSAAARPVERPQASSPLRDVSTKATTPENLRSINRPPGSRGSGCGPKRTHDAIKRNRLNRRSNRKTPAKNSHFRGPSARLWLCRRTARLRGAHRRRRNAVEVDSATREGCAGHGKRVLT